MNRGDVTDVNTTEGWRRGDRKILGLLTFSHAVQHFYGAGLALTYPFVISQFHVSYSSLGFVLAISGIVGGLLQGAAGLARKYSARSLLSAQNLSLAVATVLGAISPGFAFYGIMRFIGSLALWPQHPVGSAYLSEMFPKKKGTVLSWHTTGGTIGTLLIPIATTSIIANYGWRTALVALSIPMAIGGFIVIGKLPLEPSHVKGSAAHEQAMRAPDGPSVGTLIRRNKSAMMVIAASTVAAAGRGLGVLSAFVPIYLKNGAHLSTVTVGLVYTVLVAGGVIGPLIAGWLSDRIGRKGVLISAYLGGAITMVLFVQKYSSAWVLAAVSLVMGVLAYSESPLIQSLFSDSIGPSQARAAFGIFFAIAYGVGAIWLAIVGVMIDRYGFQAAFYMMAGSFVLSAFMIAPKFVTAHRPSAKID
ncbi:MAG: MFS transporter [Actinomycetota bacterium]|jgi:MFS family permease|nr:MFS transporter [Actinomycetota bacterium]